MIINGLKYHRGSRGSRGSYETVEVDITRSSDGTYLTTCVVNVYLLISGIASHPCGNGGDYTLTPEQQLKVLKFVQEERKKITDSFPVKTLEGWDESGLPKFDDYCFPGDTVDGEMVDYFVNSIPPVTFRSSCTQAGEAFSTELDPEAERWRDTYPTFSRLSPSLWRFEGYCFKGQTDNRVEAKTRLERRIEVLRQRRRDMYDEEKLICPYCEREQYTHEPDYISSDICNTECEHCGKLFWYSVIVAREYSSYKDEEA